MSKIFGFDLGVASIGWAVVELLDVPDNIVLDESNRLEGKILGAGVRCFDTALNGQDRRNARSMRRRIRHRAQRMREIRALLRSEGLIDIPEPKHNGHNNFYLNKDIDENIWKLRAVSAFERPLNQREVGRILYHLAKHRGYDDITYPITQGKNKEKDEEKSSDELKATGCIKDNLLLLNQEGNSNKTMCQVLYAKTPHQMPNRKKLIAKQNKKGEINYSEESTYTNSIPRSEIKREAEMILHAQKTFGNDFSDLFEKWEKIAFRQRKFNESGSPMAKSVDEMRGRCIFTNEPVAPKEAPTAQFFVALSKCNQNGFSAEQIKKVIDALYKKKTGLSYADVRKLLDYDGPFAALNYKREYDKETKKWLEPDIKKIEKEKFATFTGYHKLCDFTDNLSDMDKIFEIIATQKTPKNIEQEVSKICPEHAKQISEITTSKFLNLSLTALRTLVPEMEQGKSYSQACEAHGWNHRTSGESFVDITDEVQPGYLRRINWVKLGNRVTSPVVKRTLSQMHKVYNAMVYRYGCPDRVHLEIGRELKKSPDDIARINREIEKNRKANEEAYKEYGKHFHKYKLYMEQSGQCIYCGKKLEAGLWDAYEIDHILPYSRSLDNSQSNKVLVCRECNQRKGNKTPYEFMSNQEFFEMTVRARALNNSAKFRKLTNIDLPSSYDEKNDFIARNANDNATIARFASQYLEQGIDWGKDNKKHILVRTGALTDYLRHQWGLEKSREESDKHHAQDAIVIACATQDMVRYLATLSAKFENKWALIGENGEAWYKQLKKSISEPWTNFRADVLSCLDSVFVSRPPRCNATGQAHNETICGKNNSYNTKKKRNLEKNRGGGTLNVRFGKADRGNMFRFDIWKQKNGKHKCVPVYVSDLVEKNDVKFMVADAEFVCALHKDDYVKLTTRKGEVFEGYITQMDHGTNFILYRQDNSKVQVVKKSVGECEKIEKYSVTLLGNKKLVRLPEKRQPVVKSK